MMLVMRSGLFDAAVVQELWAATIRLVESFAPVLSPLVVQVNGDDEMHEGPATVRLVDFDPAGVPPFFAPYTYVSSRLLGAQDVEPLRAAGATVAALHERFAIRVVDALGDAPPRRFAAVAAKVTGHRPGFVHVGRAREAR